MMACQSQEDDYHYWVYCYKNKEEEEEEGRGTVLDWNLGCSFGKQETGIQGVDVGMRFLDDEHTSLAMESPVNWSNRSTGYLEDAVVEWADDRCKRRRVEMDSLNDVLKEFWNLSSSNEDPFSDFHSFSDPDTSILGGDPFNNSASIKKPINTEDTNSELQQFHLIPSSSSSSQENSTTTMSDPISKPNSDDNTEKKRKKEEVVMIGVLYPFTVVRPGGIEGVVTLDDINKRMLRRPTRPIRHPVGEFRCLPCVSAATGLGISGKSVVGLTRIHTVGRGTITIIRTSG